MASYIPIEVQRALEQIADDGGSPATLRKKAEDRIAQLEADLVSARLPTGKPADFKNRLSRRLRDALVNDPQMALNRKIVFQHALHLLIEGGDDSETPEAPGYTNLATDRFRAIPAASSMARKLGAPTRFGRMQAGKEAGLSRRRHVLRRRATINPGRRVSGRARSAARRAARMRSRQAQQRRQPGADGWAERGEPATRIRHTRWRPLA